MVKATVNLCDPKQVFPGPFTSILVSSMRGQERLAKLDLLKSNNIWRWETCHPLFMLFEVTPPPVSRAMLEFSRPVRDRLLAFPYCAVVLQIIRQWKANYEIMKALGGLIGKRLLFYADRVYGNPVLIHLGRFGLVYASWRLLAGD
jgi:hypothetical protein